MKKAFTLVELIFVIVILGILATIAIPRLAATRDDAKIVTLVEDINTALKDVSSYYIAQGDFATKISDMTGVEMVGNDTLSGIFQFKNKNCIDFNVATADADINDTAIKRGDSYIHISGGNDKSDATCESVNQAMAKLFGYHKVGGSGINWNANP